MLNIDTAATAFLEEQPLMAYLTRSLGLINEQGLVKMNQTLYKKAAKAVSGIKVSSLHPYDGVTRLNATCSMQIKSSALS